VSWREHAWEFTIGVLAWVAAVGLLAFIAVFLAYEALQRRRGASR
jgi:hypothetical protein